MSRPDLDPTQLLLVGLLENVTFYDRWLVLRTDLQVAGVNDHKHKCRSTEHISSKLNAYQYATVSEQHAPGEWRLPTSIAFIISSRSSMLYLAASGFNRSQLDWRPVTVLFQIYQHPGHITQHRTLNDNKLSWKVKTFQYLIWTLRLQLNPVSQRQQAQLKGKDIPILDMNTAVAAEHSLQPINPYMT